MAIERAMEDQGLVVIRETDLEAVPQYLSTMKNAVLHVFIEEETANFDVQVGVLKSGEYLLPWKSDSITDVMTNGQTFLEVDGMKVFFASARELFYGDNKAFLACTPSCTET